MIVIIDYGMGNLRSVLKAFKRIKVEPIISSKIEDIERADKLVLPGVGHFKRGMENLKTLGLIEALNKTVLKDKVPILGICLGMQLLTKSSEEGDVPGLGWFDAKTIKLNFNNHNFKNLKYKIPHMGWDTIMIKKPSPIFYGIEKNALFYFVHSYHVVCDNPKDLLSTTNYGCEFVSAIQKNNMFGMQFHPEKSHKNGLKILKNFVEKI